MFTFLWNLLVPKRAQQLVSLWSVQAIEKLVVTLDLDPGFVDAWQELTLCNENFLPES